MPREKQTLDELLKNLQPLDVEWKDEVAVRVLAKLAVFPTKKEYTIEDIKTLLEGAVYRSAQLRKIKKEARGNESPFDEALLICRSFLGLSSDNFKAEMEARLGPGGIGVKRYLTESEVYIAALQDLRLVEAMTLEVNRPLAWQSILEERLRFGRGSAVSGMARGRMLEVQVEEIVKKIFPGNYELRCNFLVKDGKRAKCDVAIPTADDAVIVIESKGYGATGSKMTDVIGDVEKIIKDKRADTVFILVTDGTPWRERQNDLRKLVQFQNDGDIHRIFTTAMFTELATELLRLKSFYEIKDSPPTEIQPDV